MICTSLKRIGSDDALGAVRAKGHAWGPRTSAICTIALALALPTGFLAERAHFAKAVEDTSTTDVTPWEVEYYLPFF